MRRLLSLATLYPNAHTPQFGTFVARSLEALAARDEWDVTVINPVGIPPLALGRYRALAAAAVDGVEHAWSCRSVCCLNYQAYTYCTAYCPLVEPGELTSAAIETLRPSPLTSAVWRMGKGWTGFPSMSAWSG